MINIVEQGVKRALKVTFVLQTFYNLYSKIAKILFQEDQIFYVVELALVLY